MPAIPLPGNPTLGSRDLYHGIRRLTIILDVLGLEEPADLEKPFIHQEMFMRPQRSLDDIIASILGIALNISHTKRT
jgi:hypothetical protein